MRKILILGCLFMAASCKQGRREIYCTDDYKGWVVVEKFESDYTLTLKKGCEYVQIKTSQGEFEALSIFDTIGKKLVSQKAQDIIERAKTESIIIKAEAYAN